MTGNSAMWERKRQSQTDLGERLSEFVYPLTLWVVIYDSTESLMMIENRFRIGEKVWGKKMEDEI